MFCASLLLLAFAYGVAVGRFEIFPYPVISDAISTARVMRHGLTGEKSWLYMPTTYTRKLPTYRPEAAYPGLNLVTAVADIASGGPAPFAYHQDPKTGDFHLDPTVAGPDGHRAIGASCARG